MKRFSLTFFGTFVFCTLFLLKQEKCLAQWPRFGGIHGDFRNSGMLDQSPVEFGTWSIELEWGDAAPIVDQGFIYISEAAFTDNGQDAMNVRCIRPSTGETVWSTTVNEKSYISQDISDNYPVRPQASQLAVANRIVNMSYGGCVSCLDQATGKIIWSHDLVQEFDATPIQYGFASSPWGDGSRVVLACGGPQALFVAFDLADGKLAWKSSPGAAAYGSFAEMERQDGSKILCYLARDSLVAIDPLTGQQVWNYPLPKPGLTNAVTPIAIERNQLIVAGQGFDSSQCLKVQEENGAWSIEEVWKSKQTPFYCNSVVAAGSRELFGYRSNVLSSLDLETGKLKWRVRGWTDANFAIWDDVIVGVRGDGFLALGKLNNEGISVNKGARVVNDRVWAPPVVVGTTALIRGRHSLSAVALDQLPSIDQLPSGTEIDSMTAMYGQKYESIASLLKLASDEPVKLSFEDYRKVVEDRSVQFGESEYRSLLDSLLKSNQVELMFQIARDWTVRDPNSIVAFDKMIEALQAQGFDDKVAQLNQDRLVEVVLEVKAPETTAEDATLYLVGNAAAVGSWKTEGTGLKRTAPGKYLATVVIPKGKFEFKITQGSWDTVEVRRDGRSTSNRRRLIVQPVTIQAEVEGWKSYSKK